MKLNFLYAVAFVCFAVGFSEAQYSRYDAPVTNTPGATVQVCTLPANGVPCTNYITTYDFNNNACANSAQDTPQPNGVCQPGPDNQGRIGFWASPGNYTYTWCVPTTGPIPGKSCSGPVAFTLGSTSGGSGAVNSVSNSDSSLTVSPTVGAVVTSLNTAHANTFTATQTFPNSSITNAELANSTVTLNGTANQISSPGSTSLGGTATFALANPLTTPGPETVNGNLTTNITGSTQCVQASSSGVLSGTGSACGSGSGAVNSVTNSDSSLTVSPTTGAVVTSLNTANANTWTVGQTFSAINLTGSTQGYPLGIGTSGGATQVGQIAVEIHSSLWPGLTLDQLVAECGSAAACDVHLDAVSAAFNTSTTIKATNVVIGSTTQAVTLYLHGTPVICNTTVSTELCFDVRQQGKLIGYGPGSGTEVGTYITTTSGFSGLAVLGNGVTNGTQASFQVSGLEIGPPNTATFACGIVCIDSVEGNTDIHNVNIQGISNTRSWVFRDSPTNSGADNNNVLLDNSKTYSGGKINSINYSFFGGHGGAADGFVLHNLNAGDGCPGVSNGVAMCAGSPGVTPVEIGTVANCGANCNSITLNSGYTYDFRTIVVGDRIIIGGTAYMVCGPSLWGCSSSAVLPTSTVVYVTGSPTVTSTASLQFGCVGGNGCFIEINGAAYGGTAIENFHSDNIYIEGESGQNTSMDWIDVQNVRGTEMPNVMCNVGTGSACISIYHAATGYMGYVHFGGRMNGAVATNAVANNVSGNNYYPGASSAFDIGTYTYPGEQSGPGSVFDGAVDIAGNLTTNITGSTQCVQANSSGVLSGTGSACGSGGGSPAGSQYDVQINGGSSTFAAVATHSAATGAILTANNAAAPTANNPAISDSTNSPVSLASAAYTLQCPTSTVQEDNGYTLRITTSGSHALVIPLSSSTGCSGAYFPEILNLTASSVTVNVTSGDTANVVGNCGSSCGSGQTTFTLPSNGTLALNQNTTSQWNAKVDVPATTGVTSIATTAPLAGGTITSTGTISITGAAGQVLAGAGPAFTATPTLGVVGTTTGTLDLASSTAGGSNTITPGAIGAAYTSTLAGQTGTINSMATTSTTANQTMFTTTTAGGTAFGDFWGAPQFVPAANCNNATAGPGWSIGSGGTATCRAGTNNLGGYIAITDTSTTFAEFQVQIPGDWDTATEPYIAFDLAYPGTDGSSSHTIIPAFKISCAKGDGSTTDDVTFNASHSSGTITLSSATANLYFSGVNSAGSKVQMNSTDTTGCIAGSLMIVQVGRATDTATSAVNFYGAAITWPHKTPGTAGAN